MYRDFRIVVGSKGIGRATQDGVQHLQTALGSPGAYAPGSPPAMEGGLTNHTSSHRNWTTDGGHVMPTSCDANRYQSPEMCFPPRRILVGNAGKITPLRGRKQANISGRLTRIPRGD